MNFTLHRSTTQQGRRSGFLSTFRIMSPWPTATISAQVLWWAVALELQIRLEKEGELSENGYVYAVCLGDGKSEKRPTYSLLEYAQRFARDSSIQDKTKRTATAK